MNLLAGKEDVSLTDENLSGLSRRSFFKRATVVGATSSVALSGFARVALASDGDNDNDNNGLKKRDLDILVAAEIAEALAVTTYSNIINIAPFFPRLPLDDQGYLVAARQ